MAGEEMVMVTPGRGLPSVSVTVPRREPVSSCPQRLAAKRKAKLKTKSLLKFIPFASFHFEILPFIS
jgi:hypothetical protein